MWYCTTGTPSARLHLPVLLQLCTIQAAEINGIYLECNEENSLRNAAFWRFEPKSRNNLMAFGLAALSKLKINKKLSKIEYFFVFMSMKFPLCGSQRFSCVISCLHTSRSTKNCAEVCIKYESVKSLHWLHAINIHEQASPINHH